MNMFDTYKLVNDTNNLKENKCSIEKSKKLYRELRILNEQLKIYGSLCGEAIVVPSDKVQVLEYDELPENIKKELSHAQNEMTGSTKSAIKQKKTCLKKSLANNIEVENLLYSTGNVICDKCNAPMNFIDNKTVCSELVYNNGHYKLVHNISSFYKCLNCLDLNEENYLNTTRVNVKNMPIINFYASASILAELFYKKFCQGLTYSEQEKIWAESGLLLFRESMIKWTIDANNEIFESLRVLIFEDIKDSSTFFIDSMPLKAGNSNSKAYFNFIANAEKDGFKAILFDYSKMDLTDTDNFFNDFKDNLLKNKKILLTDTVECIEATASIYTLILTAKMNDISIKPYLEYILNEIPNLDVISEDVLRKYLPYSKDLPDFLKDK